jgi:hypothetical protein
MQPYHKPDMGTLLASDYDELLIATRSVVEGVKDPSSP